MKVENSSFTFHENVTTHTNAFFRTPSYSWKLWLNSNTWFMYEEGKQPNAFHRLMQRLILGFKWERIK